MIKFGIKIGLLTGGAYYIAEQGVWRDSNTTLTLYNKIKDASCPYTQEITKQIPYELPKLPSSGEVSYLTKYYWNRGVMATFEFIANAPSNISDLSSKGLNMLLDNSELKKVLSTESEIKK